MSTRQPALRPPKAADRSHVNGITGAFVHTYRPVRIYVARYTKKGTRVRNVLARSLRNPAQFPSPYWHLIQEVETPEEADWRLLDADLNAFEEDEAEFQACLETFGPSTAPWLFLDHRDASSPLKAPDGALALKPNALIDKSERGVQVKAIPYWEMIDDFLWYENSQHYPAMDLSFIGEWTDFRSTLTDRLRALVPLSDFVLRDRFFHGPILSAAPSNHGERPLAEDSRRSWRERHIASARNARFILCPMGYGPLSFRFYEAMSLERPPILVSGACELPFTGFVDYEDFCFRVDAERPDAANQIAALIRDVDTDRWSDMAVRARAAFDTHLSIRAMPLHLHRMLQSPRAPRCHP